MQNTQYNIDDIQELLGCLPETDDVESIILKAHLISEQLLHKLLDVKLTNPKALNNARINVKLLIRFTESLFEENLFTKPCCWGPLYKLNDVRNTIAHQLSPNDLDEQISNMITNYEKAKGWRPAEYTDGTKATKLKYAVAMPLHFLAGAIAALRSEEHQAK